MSTTARRQASGEPVDGRATFSRPRSVFLPFHPARLEIVLAGQGGSIAVLVDIDGLEPDLTRPLDLLAADLAAEQGGAVGWEQLLALGFTRGQIEKRVSQGRLHRIHVGVFAPGHTLLEPRGQIVAALLAVGPGALTSHTSGCWLWEIRRNPGLPVHVTITGRSRRRRGGIHIHQPRRLHPDDIDEKDGIPVTSVARTLLDLAEMVDKRELRRCFEEADRLGILDLAQVRALCLRTTGRRGLAQLDRLVEEARAGERYTRSELEQRFLELCAEAGLPAPQLNVLVSGLEVDAYWPHAGLVVELDGFRWHRGRADFERDRTRDLVLQGAGLRVIRLTGRQLTGQRDRILATLDSILRSPVPG